MIAYRGTLDILRELAWFVAKLLAAEQRRRGTPRGSRAPSCFWRAVAGPRWFRDRTTCDALTRDHGISRATAYPYVDEVVAALAAQAPDLHAALDRVRDKGFSHVILDGKVIACDRCKEPVISVTGQLVDVWYSGNAHGHGGNIQAVAAPDGSRYGSPTSSPTRCTTSPPRGAPSRRFTLPPPGYPHSPILDMRERASAS